MKSFNLIYYDFYQLILTIFIFLLGLVLCMVFAKKKSDIKYVFFLYTWHTLFSVYYWYFTLSNQADAIKYFRKSFSLTPNFSPGTRFTETVAFVITKTLDSNYLNTTLVSNIFGSIGILILYLCLEKYIFILGRRWLLILFIPSMSFWSSGLGKDSISFMATCIFLYAITSYKKVRISVLFAVLAMFMVRPHIALCMVLSFIIYFIARSKIHIIVKFISLPMILGASIFLLQFVQQYVGITEVSIENLDSYVDKRQNSNLDGGSSLDISSMSYPMQMFTYIFRPLPFEAHSAVALISGIENTFLLILFIYIVIKSKFNFESFIRGKNLWLSAYVFLTCTILAITTANLGIAARQKWMFMPVLIYLLIYAFHDYKTKKHKVYS